MNANNLVVQGDDQPPPPPPYSETDIYSATSHHSHSPAHSRAHSHSHSHSHSPHPVPAPFPSAVDDSASRVSSSSTTDGGDVIFTPPLTPRTSSSHAQDASLPLPTAASPSAQLYFDERPAPAAPGDALVHTVAVRPRSSPDDLPYQSEWARRGVTIQDWATFVNFLIPDHDVAQNEAILGDKSGDDTEKASAFREHPSEHGAQRRREVEATLRQWNEGFFAPRGMTVQLDAEAAADDQRVPGALDTTFDGATTAQGGPTGQRDAAVPAELRDAAASDQRGGWGRSFGGFRIGNNSIRYGDSFVADSNGLRIGSLVMDNNGIRMDGGRGRGEWPSWGRGPPGPPRFGGPHHHPPPPFGGPPGLQDRGRPATVEPNLTRSRSSSASSSVSSASSSSTSSIGSLPDYDQLSAQQYPTYISRLQSWTARPEQLRTRADVKALKADIKASKAEAVADGMDRDALRAQVKSLSQQWRQLKKQQRRIRKEQRRERRQRRRAEKRERRTQRREMKRAQRDYRRGRSGPPGPQIQMPPINVPPINVPAVHVPPVHVPRVSVPRVSVPSFAGPSCGGCGGWGGRGRGRGGFGFFGPSGPLGPNGPLGERGPLGYRNAPGAAGESQSAGPFGARAAPFDRGPARGRTWGPRGGPFPGSWPDDPPSHDAPDDDDDAAPPPGPASAAKYRTVEGLETEIASKTAALDALSGGEQWAAAKEIEALVERLENVRIEADEAYARELAAKDHGS